MVLIFLDTSLLVSRFVGRISKFDGEMFPLGNS